MLSSDHSPIQVWKHHWKSSGPSPAHSRTRLEQGHDLSSFNVFKDNDFTNWASVPIFDHCHCEIYFSQYLNGVSLVTAGVCCLSSSHSITPKRVRVYLLIALCQVAEDSMRILPLSFCSYRLNNPVLPGYITLLFLMILMAFGWTTSSLSMSFLYWEAPNWTQYSWCNPRGLSHLEA